jgi:hypothetical protein
VFKLFFRSKKPALKLERGDGAIRDENGQARRFLRDGIIFLVDYYKKIKIK